MCAKRDALCLLEIDHVLGRSDEPHYGEASLSTARCRHRHSSDNLLLVIHYGDPHLML